MNDVITRPRVLIVEDDRDNLEALSMLLESKYDVFGYQSSLAALETVEVTKPDVLLLDIGMAQINGVQFLKLIRAMPGYRHVPAVAFTGYAREVERQGFLAAGFEIVLVKPVLDPQELFGAIDGLLHRVAVSRLDGRTTKAASVALGFGEAERPEPARLRNGNAG
jgi:CheY-like chemotaxis protein